MKDIIAIINGPNLNLVGKRETEIYGNTSFEAFIPALREKYADIHIAYHQSNHEGTLIDLVQHYGYLAKGIVLNPGGYTHTSIALADAVKAVPCPIVEVHLSDIMNRETYRRHSYIQEHCIQSIMGKGMEGYEMGIQILLEKSPIY